MAESKEFNYGFVLKEQETLFASIQKVANRVLKYKNPPRQLLLGRLTNLQHFWERCRRNHADLLANQKVADDPDQDGIDYQEGCYEPDDFIETEDLYEEAIDYILSNLPDYQPVSENNRSGTPLTESTPRATSSPAVKLPRISIPSFSGSYCEWLNYRDLFKSLVIDNDRLSDAERLHYLKSSLQGEASIVAQNQPGTDGNFANIWKNLEARYNDNKVLIYEYLRKIVELPTVSSDFLSNLKNMRNVIIASISALKSLKRPIDEGNDLVVFMLINKLDKISRDQWELSLNDTTDPPPLDQFVKFLDNRIRALEATVDIKKRNDTKNSNVSQSLRQKVHTHQNSAKLFCPLCQGDHNLYVCSSFKEKTIDERFEYLRANSRCFNCLGKHNRSCCQSKKLCNFCKKPHHSLLHREIDSSAPQSRESKPDNNLSESTSQKSEVTFSSHLNSTKLNRRAVLLATARVIVEAPDGRRVYIRALLDQASETSFISESIAQLLRLPRTSNNITVSGVGGISTSKIIYTVPIAVKSTKSCNTVLQTQALVLPKITAYIPAEFTTLEIPENLRELDLADPKPWNNDRIDLLIGGDLYSQTLKPDICFGPPGDLIAQATIFGWVLSGPLQRSTTQSYHINVHHSSENKIDDILRQFWELEELPKVNLLSSKDIECENHFIETHSRNEIGKYVVKLPFHDSPAQLGNSYNIALASFNRLEKKLVNNPELKEKYCDFLADYEKLGHMTPVDSAQDVSSRVFIPHHPVIRDTSQTTKLRVVFNASSPTSTKVSLNDILHSGPKLQIEISSIILRWRQHEFVLCADIANMFRQILVAPCDRQFQCILWRDSVEKPVQSFELNTVTYGMSCSPYLAIRVLQQLAKDEKSNCPLAAPVLLDQTYVDDVFIGGSKKRATLELRDQVIRLTQAGDFSLRKWFSNSPDLLMGLESADHGLAVEIPFNNTTGFKVLGIFWDPSDDAFHFQTSEFPAESTTKRTLLSAVAKLFDPMGWISPVIIVAKILLQKLWLRKVQWDDPLPPDLIKEWQQFCLALQALSKLTIPRWTYNNPHVLSIEIHGFSDSSSVAYAAVVYSRVQTVSGSYSVSLLMAKSKVAPLKTISIPRLELCAANLLSKLIRYVVDSLHLTESKIYCWTDSTIVLGWLHKQPTTWTTFVANRVSNILTELPSAEWNHVPSKQNPADCASRGLSAEELTDFSLWWKGPTWLHAPVEEWPKRNDNVETNEEMRTVSHLVNNRNELDWQSVLLQRQSSWARLLRVTVQIMRAIKAFKEKIKFSQGCSALEINDAALFWVRYIQSKFFHLEIQLIKEGQALPSSSNLRKFTPFVDENGVLRLGGRVQKSKLLAYQVPPAILPSHAVPKLILEQLHCNLLHGGLRLTLYMCRTQYWILGARSLIKEIIKKCVVCVRDQARVENQVMGDLPSARVSPSRPFSHTGVDYAGPFFVRSSSGRGAKSHKAWIALFVCFAVKAIHLELVHDYSSDSFLAALRRFTSRRGLPTDLYSDNGTNFRGADSELVNAFRLVLKDPTVASHLAADSIKWHFIPPSAPNFGGLWEAGVKNVKFHLRKLLSNSTPTSEEFTTLLCQIESCLNSRPLVALNEDPDSCEALTPGHFLIGSALKTVPAPSLIDVPENLLSRWQFYQRVLEHFWRSWARDYLQSLQQRAKWFSARPNLQVNDLVLLKNPHLPPAKWELGRITKCIPGQDGITRVVQVKTSQSDFTRPISKLVKLPCTTI